MNREEIILKTIEKLCDEDSYFKVYHKHTREISMPSLKDLENFVEICKAIIFPGYFGKSDFSRYSIKYDIGYNINIVYSILSEQIIKGLCFVCDKGNDLNCGECEAKAKDITLNFISKLPMIREMLYLDVKAAFLGDPAAKYIGEIIYCYPSITSLIHHRIAHELFNLGVPIIPRIISELSHSITGIDIHPGATIGKSFFIDHGTGVVIGETSIIGDNVRIYQGVTLGAKSFPLDKDGNPIKGIPRHPIVEDNVIIYSGATILGRIRIGRNSIIGGNMWITEDVPPDSKLVLGKKDI